MPLCSTVLQNIKIFYRGPVMSVVTFNYEIHGSPKIAKFTNWKSGIPEIMITCEIDNILGHFT